MTTRASGARHPGGWPAPRFDRVRLGRVLIQKPDDSLAWSMIAFGERHPADERTRNVYEWAHKRQHGRYP
jgi:hypothetical protein